MLEEIFIYLPIPIFIIIYCISNIKNRDYFWNILFSIGILPFAITLVPSIGAVFNGTGMGDKGGIDAGKFVYLLLLVYFWYIYAGAIMLLIFVIKKKKNKQKKKTSIIERTIMLTLIITNAVFAINWISVFIIERPLLLYKPFDASNNIYYGIGVIVEKNSEMIWHHYIDFQSLIIFFLIIFANSLVIFWIIKIISNNHQRD
jgi:hypothetical protein